MYKPKLVRITTVPISLEKLLEGQLTFMSGHFELIAMSAQPEQLKEFGKQNGVRVQPLPLTRKITPLKDLIAIIRLVRFLRQERPEIVHTHTPKAGMVGMLAARLAGVPNRMHTVAGLPLMEARGLKRSILEWVERFTYAMATHVYPNSFVLKDFIVKKGWTKSSKLKVLGHGSSNGIDTSYFDPKMISSEAVVSWKNKLGIGQKDRTFVFVGRLVGDKGINELVQAFSGIRKTYETTHLLLVGPTEPELDPLLKETTELIESDTHIHSLGYQKDVRPFLALSDALVFPSYREGFPNVVMQAAAMGLACVVTDINGCNEIIADEQNGLIVPPKDTASLQNAMHKLLEDEELLSRLSTRARSSVVSRYERLEFWDNLLQEYRQILNS